MARTRLYVALVLLFAAAPAQGQTTTLKNAVTGDPQIKSIEAIRFGPDGLLLIGDGRGAQLVAVDTGDTKPQLWTKTEMPGIQDKLAGRIGTTGKGIEIVKLAVNPASHTAYVAIRKVDDRRSLLLTIDGTGTIGEFALDNVKHVRVALPTGGKSTITAITDVAWAGDRVLVAAQANETFGSKIFSVPAPLENNGKGTVFSTQTYHVAHGQWETHAPIRTVLPYEENGKKYLVGAFTCTPIVKYALDDLQPGAKVKGVSVIELGSGNHPRDMFTYEKGGKKYILMSTFRFHHKQAPVGPSPYWTVRVDHDILAENAKVNEKALQRLDSKRQPATDRARVVESYHGVVHLSRLDEERALVLRQDDKGVLSLAALALP